ncbi:MAG: hypothetical protein R2734_04405 [Nocardioides sp.]
MSSTPRTSPATSATAARWPSSSGPGSTTYDGPLGVARSTQVLVPSRVIGDGLGASTHSLATPNRPPRQAVMAPPGDRR